MSEAEFHRKFSAKCFNDAWGLIDKPARSESENREMLLLAYAALWHWTQRDDCAAKNVSVGWWQVARIHALLGEPQSAYRAGEASLTYAKEQPPFYAGYAHEALARAASVANDKVLRERHLKEARRRLAEISDEKERRMLETDLESIARQSAA